MTLNDGLLNKRNRNQQFHGQYIRVFSQYVDYIKTKWRFNNSEHTVSTIELAQIATRIAYI